MIYECEPPPIFAAISGDAVVGKPPDELRAKIKLAMEVGYRLSPRQELAYELYSASFSQSNADARFILLFMALETLISPNPRDRQVKEHVQRLINETMKAGLRRSETSSLTGSLIWLLDKSIGQAGRRLARSLGDRRYMDKRAPEFFTDCYTVRSQLVHGHSPRPTREEVDTRAAHLETFVGDLLSGPLID